MDMNRTFFLRKEDREPRWHVVDASGRVLGRLCTQIADLLRGKTKATYTPQTDAGDYVVVINCDKIKLTGKFGFKAAIWSRSRQTLAAVM